MKSKRKPSGGVPSPAGTVEARQQEVVKMLLEGIPRAEIIAICCEKYGISSRTTDDDLAEAKRRIAASFNPEEVSFAAGLSIQRFNLCFQKALAEGDIRSAIASQTQLARIFCLDQAKATLSLAVDDPTDISKFPAEIKKAIFEEGMDKMMIEIRSDRNR